MIMAMVRIMAMVMPKMLCWFSLLYLLQRITKKVTAMLSHITLFYILVKNWYKQRNLANQGNRESV